MLVVCAEAQKRAQVPGLSASFPRPAAEMAVPEGGDNLEGSGSGGVGHEGDGCLASIAIDRRRCIWRSTAICCMQEA